jgi:hypothetical protein
MTDFRNNDWGTMRWNYKFNKIIPAFLGIMFIGVLCGCERKTTTSDQPLSRTIEDEAPAVPWDEGFNTSWEGIYKSLPSAEYAVTFDLSVSGLYKLSYGEGAVTTYSGRYNNGFGGGTSKSKFQYTITGLSVTGFDEKTITISVNWKLPNGNDTETYVLYKQ